MAPSLPKEYKAAIFKKKGEDLVFENRPLELPKAGEVNSPVAPTVALTDGSP